MPDIKNILTELMKNLTKSSSGIVKSTKLNITLMNEEENLKSIYLKIGKKVDDIYTYGGSLGEYFDGKFKEILVTQEKIKEIKLAIQDAKGTKKCGTCKNDVLKNAHFCPKCGNNMNDAGIHIAEKHKETEYNTDNKQKKIEYKEAIVETKQDKKI